MHSAVRHRGKEGRKVGRLKNKTRTDQISVHGSDGKTDISLAMSSELKFFRVIPNACAVNSSRNKGHLRLTARDIKYNRAVGLGSPASQPRSIGARATHLV